ncbi:MAG: Coenzyme F420 hydrogenase/dehydrogenase, beta subunit C-terminal domain, partial [Candidatus Sumerlaeota bacterium]|nr:Coenzyme F420 hydrogenase/dehydrogenase, beta subunit C-terminal domain [Candidatus Sumerlaeota bacterium]
MNKTECNSCGLCAGACPSLDRNPVSVDRFVSPQVFAAWNKDHAVRLDSTSGGIFSALADKMFDADGFVGGALYQKDHTVSHILTNNRFLLDDIRSSKYLQSYTGDLFSEIRQILENDQKVLVCATPCQIAGLYSVLGKDYEKLVTCDFICVGVGSPKVFLKYMDMLEHRFGARATKIKFKNKTFGWHRCATRIDFANGKTYIQDRYHDPYMRSLLNAHIVRPSCYECRFKGMPRQADITLADFWGIDDLHPELDNDCGTSAVLLNSQKGKELFQSAEETIISQECLLRDVAADNRAISQSIEHAHDRERFFSDIDNMPFAKVADKHCPRISLFSRLKLRIPARYRDVARRVLVCRKL